MERVGAEFEIKAVSAPQRLIEGYAAAFGNLDRAGDVIDAKAFDRTLRETPLARIGVFVAHDMSKLPVGVPVAVKADPKGLLTTTRIFKTQAGDDLLNTAAELLAAGQPLGMSIGYRVVAHMPDRVAGQPIRKLTDIDLVEYSYAAAQTIANPEALTVGVKTEGAMDAKAEWTAAFINNLPDSAFAYVEPGGTKDDEGKTVPRSLRHFPHHDPGGAVDLAHLRNALSRAPQSPFGDKALAHLKRHAAAEGVGGDGKTADDAHDPAWGEGAGPALLVAAHGLEHLAEEVVAEQKAMATLGQDTKAGRRMQAQMRGKLRAIIDQLAALEKWAEYADRDQEGKAAAERARREIALMEVAL